MNSCATRHFQKFHWKISSVQFLFDTVVHLYFLCISRWIFSPQSINGISFLSLSPFFFFSLEKREFYVRFIVEGKRVSAWRKRYRSSLFYCLLQACTVQGGWKVHGAFEKLICSAIENYLYNFRKSIKDKYKANIGI